MLNGISVFSTEQQDVINRAVRGEDLSVYGKANLIDCLNHVIKISKDNDLIEFFTQVQAKVDGLSDEEWESELGNMPYRLPFSGDSREFDGDSE